MGSAFINSHPINDSSILPWINMYSSERLRPCCVYYCGMIPRYVVKWKTNPWDSAYWMLGTRL